MTIFKKIISLLLLSSAMQAQTKAPFVLGWVDTVQSTILQEKRVLNIYLPVGYHPDSAARYPVIYLLDGSADEDFIHVAGLVQFCNFPWVNLLPPSIVVGIANTNRRRDFTFPTTVAQDKKDYPESGGSAAFIRFVENELQPYIQEQYKTNGTKMLIGQSLGGLLATEILFTQPQLFTHYAIVSPSLWWDNQSLLRRKVEVLQAGAKRPAKIFIAVGKEGPIMEGDARRLYQLLKTGNKLNLQWQYYGKLNHANILHQALYDAFGYFGGK
jgi:uncharacterized protein